MLLNTKRHGSALKELGLVGVAIMSVDRCQPMWYFIRNTHDMERSVPGRPGWEWGGMEDIVCARVKRGKRTRPI